MDTSYIYYAYGIRDFECTKTEYKGNTITKVSHLPFYGLLQIIASCNILIDSLLTFCK